MVDTMRDRLRKAQLRDVAEQQAIYEAAANGATADEACRRVIGGAFNLSEDVSKQIEERGTKACESSL